MSMKIEFFPILLMADCTNPKSVVGLLIEAASLIRTSQYLLGLVLFVLIFLYNFLEFHLFRDLLKGFRGDQVTLTFNPRSHIYEGVVSKCRILHGRYLATPWLSNPHFQTAFLNFFGRPPVFNYKRQVFQIPDGGTIALDWLMASDIGRGAFGHDISEDDLAPIVVVIPGLMSDSSSAYIKHLVFKIAKRGWNVVVSNHRGLGGISLTSDCFYNAGWTEDVRRVINYLHQEHPKSPLFAVGTSIGANILVKYLGENREDTPIAGAASICSPWDLVVCDRFITRRLIQRFYDRALTIGLQGYAQIHQTVYSRLADWEGIKKSRSVRDFDNYATCLVGKFETVDTYYRHCSSASFVGNVAVPLLCISALDDPVCTKEAIPWDECRANRNVILATTRHGGHLGFFEGILGDRLWWVRAVDEFLGVLHSSPFMHGQKENPCVCQHFSTESNIDRGPYLNMMDDGMVSAMCNEGTQIDKTEDASEDLLTRDEKTEITTVVVESEEQKIEENPSYTNEAIPYLKFEQRNQIVNDVKDITAPVKKRMKQLLKQNKTSVWFLMYIAVITTWPLVGPALLIFFKRKLKNVLPPAWPRR